MMISDHIRFQHDGQNRVSDSALAGGIDRIDLVPGRASAPIVFVAQNADGFDRIHDSIWSDSRVLPVDVGRGFVDENRVRS